MDNGEPVYIKGGTGDRLLLGLTTGLIGIGLIGVAQTVWQLLNK